jgi:ribose transport system permease protein
MSAIRTVVPSVFAKPWIWAFLGAFAAWLATIVFTRGMGGGQILTAAFTFAVFFVIVGIGQMFVLTLGPGNVDLSVPATITLAGTVSIKLMDGQDGLILLGFAVALGIGVGIGIVNDRANLMDLEKHISGDRYTFIRDAYLQRRRNLVYDGQPPREKLE